MKKILSILSSARGEASNSMQLVNAIVSKLQESHPESEHLTRNLVHDESPNLNETHLNAFFNPDDSPEYQKNIRHSDEVIQELEDADIIVIGVPIYNFNIPSALKAWIDNIVRAHKTFVYSTDGPEGLLKNKKVYLAIASGGVYSDGPMKSYDFASSYLNSVLGFIGLQDITTFRAEGVSIPGIMEDALQKAIENIVI